MELEFLFHRFFEVLAFLDSRIEFLEVVLDIFLVETRRSFRIGELLIYGIAFHV